MERKKEVLNRKEAILNLLNIHKYLRRGMIQQDLFNIPSGERRCQILLQKMVKQRLINRFRLDSREQYIYHLEKRSQKWQHWLMINDFALKRRLKPGQELLYWRFEYKYPYGQSDALYCVKTGPSGGVLFFLEADDGANGFESKISNYEKYYISRQWANEPWADPLGKGRVTFPLILVITPRPKEIKALVRARAVRTTWEIISPEETESFVASICT
jgi:hypothetical protein